MKKIKILVFNEDIVLNHMIDAFKSEADCEIIKDNFLEAISFENEKILLAFTTDIIGSNCKLMNFIREVNEKGILFENSYGGILTNSENDLYTKTLAQQVVFLLNKVELGFIGQPLIEVIGNYKNYESWHKLYTDKNVEEINELLIKKFAKRFMDFKHERIEHPKILVLHASSHQTSNTLMLWKMIKKNLEGYDIKEMEIEDGQIIDCSGCAFETCLHYAKNNSCYYGGVIVEDILPAIEECDYIVWICPNYNDSISAKLMAVINRMTVLYRRISLKNKVLFSVIISGNSGSDSVAKHIISGLNLNKGFILPPDFSIMSIANDSGKIKYVEGIEKLAYEYAEKIKKY